MDINLVLQSLGLHNNNYRLSTNADDGSATIVFWDSTNTDASGNLVTTPPTPQQLATKWSEISSNYNANIDPVFSAVDSTKMPLAGGTFTGSVTFEDAINENVYSITDGASVDLDPDNGTIQTWGLATASRTATESFTSGQSMLLNVLLIGSYTITFPTITWVGGTAPTLATGAVSNFIELWKSGSVLYGAYLGST